MGKTSLPMKRLKKDRVEKNWDDQTGCEGGGKRVFFKESA